MDTAGTLYDYYESKVLQKFKKYLAKVQMFKDLDLKMIGTIAVVAVGVILGIFVLLG